MMNKRFPLLVIFLFGTAVAVFGREWTNTDGQAIQAEFVEFVDDDMVTIRMDGSGYTYDYPIAKLSENDRNYLDGLKAKQAVEEKYAKLADRRARWTDDYEDAVEEAKETNLPILLFFTGSDWCGYCIRLKKNVFDERDFEEFANGNLVLVEVDFPRSGLSGSQEKENNALKKQYGVTGYPTVYIIDPKEETLGRIGGYGGQSPEEYIKQIEDLIKKRKS